MGIEPGLTSLNNLIPDLVRLDCRALRSLGIRYWNMALGYLVIGIGRFGRACSTHIQWSNAQRPLKKREALDIRPGSTAQCLG